MTRVFFLIAAVALLAQAPAPRPSGPSPADLYHQGARAFVDGENDAARRAVEAGLAAAPDDARLQALKDLIDQQDQEDDQEDGGQQDQSQNSDPGEQDQDGEQGEDGQNPPDQPEDGSGDAEQDQTRTAPPQQTTEGETPPPARERGQMSAAQAERILDAVGGEERLLLRELNRAPSQRSRSDKDW